MKLKNIMQMSILLAASGAFMVSCNNQWDDHTSVTGSVAGSVTGSVAGSMAGTVEGSVESIGAEESLTFSGV